MKVVHFTVNLGTALTPIDACSPSLPFSCRAVPRTERVGGTSNGSGEDERLGPDAATPLIFCEDSELAHTGRHTSAHLIICGNGTA